MRHLLMAICLAAAGSAVTPALAAPAIPTLSYFKPFAGGFNWVRLEGGRTERAIAGVVGKGQPIAAWAPGGRQALVWLNDWEHAAPAKAWTVALPTGAAASLPLPGPGELKKLGFDNAGRLTALTLIDADDKGGPTLKQDPRGSILTFEGRRYQQPPGQEGMPALAIAYRREGASWKRTEIKLTTTGWDYAMGIRALDAANALTPDSTDMREEKDLDAVQDPALMKRLGGLDPNVATPDDGEWAKLTTPGGPVFIWRESGEFLHSSNLLAWGPASKPTRIAGLEFKHSSPHVYRQGAPNLRLVSVNLRGNHMLVTDSDGAFPRLFDTLTKKRVPVFEGAVGASFWP
ncbi:MAG: hypothetical protein ACK46X_08645 [Candidatus Sericytochromatia bacterium]